MIKGTVHWEDTVIQNISEPTGNNVSKYIRQNYKDKWTNLHSGSFFKAGINKISCSFFG